MSQNFVDLIRERAKHGAMMDADMSLMIQTVFEKTPSKEQELELIRGAAALHDLRMEALFEAYSSSIEKEGFFHAQLESSIMGWWGISEDLRDTADAIDQGSLSRDEKANALMGIQTLGQIRMKKFERAFEKAINDKGI